MGQDEDSLSGSNNSTKAGASSARTRPNCARCRNHGLTVRLEGHKTFCRYRKCRCEKCSILKERQVIMARQTALKRRQKLEETHERQPGEVDHLHGMDHELLTSVCQGSSRIKRSCDGNSVHSSLSDHDSPGVLSSISDERIPSTSKITPIHQPPPSPNTNGIELLLSHSMKFLKHCYYSWDKLHLTLMYVILKDSKINIEEATKRILEANNEILEFSQKMYQSQTDYLRDIKPEFLRDIKPEFLRDIKPEFLRDIKPEFLRDVKPEFIRDIKPELLSAMKPELLHQMKSELPFQLKPEQYQIKSDIPYQIKPELLYQIKPELQYSCVNIPMKPFGAPTYLDRVPFIGGIPPGYPGYLDMHSRLFNPHAKVPTSLECLPEPSTT